MANDIKRIEIGAGTISVSDYVTAGGAGSYVDIGYTEGPATIEVPRTMYEVKPDQVLGGIRAVPTEYGIDLKFAMIEAAGANAVWALGQAAGNLTGTPPNTTMLIGDPIELYKQMKLVTKGGRLTAVGVDATQTWTFWRCFVKALDAIGVTKAKEKVLGVTMGVLYDESVATADKYGKVVNASGT